MALNNVKKTDQELETEIYETMDLKETSIDAGLIEIENTLEINDEASPNQPMALPVREDPDYGDCATGGSSCSYTQYSLTGDTEIDIPTGAEAGDGGVIEVIANGFTVTWGASVTQPTSADMTQTDRFLASYVISTSGDMLITDLVDYAAGGA